jgi:hypothetical protein
MDKTNVKVLPLQNLHDRHPGLTPALSEAYCEAARVCLDRHHESPAQFQLYDDAAESKASIDWCSTDDRTRRAWANKDDATRDGAYAVAIASTELARNLIAVSRAETRTGADYYVAPPDSPYDDLESWVRLEVSGTDLDDRQVEYRLDQKVQQAKKGNSNLPALAAVVGFRASIILLKSVENS